jgi:nucleotide-binding universal stress UspA family protein
MRRVSMFLGTDYAYADLEHNEELEKAEALKKLESLSGLPEFADVKVNTSVIENEEDDIIATLLNFLNHKDHSYLVIGTSGDEHKSQSNAELIARKSVIPVITVKDADTSVIKKVLLPTDFRNINQHFMRDLTALTEAANAEMEILFVNTPKTFTITKEINRYWKRFKFRFSLPISVTLSVRNAHSIESEILNYAKETGADMIALPTHGKTGLERFFDGSYMEDIVRGSSLPVYSYNMHNDERKPVFHAHGYSAGRGFTG